MKPKQRFSKVIFTFTACDAFWSVWYCSISNSKIAVWEPSKWSHHLNGRGLTLSLKNSTRQHQEVLSSYLMSFPIKSKNRSSCERQIKVLKVLNQFKFRKGQMMLACLKFKSHQRRHTAVSRICAHPQDHPFSRQRQAMIWISNSVNVMHPYDW